MLKFGSTYSYIFRLHQNPGEQGLDTCNKVDWQGKLARPMGFTIWIDVMVPEG